MNLMSGRVLSLLAIVAFGLVSPAPIQAWKWNAGGLERIPLSHRLQWVAANASADLNGDGIAEILTINRGSAAIRTGNQRRWQSPETWQISQAQITDLNHDKVPEVTLLVWRPFKPWPVDAWLPNGGRIQGFHDANGMSCHIILIGWKQGAYRELWAGSAMANPVKHFSAVDLTGNGKQYLVTLEGEYEDPYSAPAHRLKVWEWNGFGFTVVHKLEDAQSFSLMSTAQLNDRQVLILAR
jgi:hypothetical protein